MPLPEQCCALTRNDDNENDVWMTKHMEIYCQVSGSDWNEKHVGLIEYLALAASRPPALLCCALSIFLDQQ